MEDTVVEDTVVVGMVTAGTAIEHELHLKELNFERNGFAIKEDKADSYFRMIDFSFSRSTFHLFPFATPRQAEAKPFNSTKYYLLKNCWYFSVWYSDRHNTQLCQQNKDNQLWGAQSLKLGTQYVQDKFLALDSNQVWDYMVLSLKYYR